MIAEQAARAADELAQHDVAASVLQAGPTSVARAEDIARRERAARCAVGTEREADAFANLRSAVAAEARRINGLMYCARLRCLIMPLRFDMLVQVESVAGAQRQPLNFETTDYLGWLLDEAKRVRPTFMKQVQAAVSDFSRATTPADVGLDLPFDLWRKKARSGNFSLGDVV